MIHLFVVASCLLVALSLILKPLWRMGPFHLIIGWPIAMLLACCLLGLLMPFIIVGRFGRELIILKPLKQVEADVGFMCVKNADEWGHFNWDPPWLLVDGYCGLMGDN